MRMGRGEPIAAGTPMPAEPTGEVAGAAGAEEREAAAGPSEAIREPNPTWGCLVAILGLGFILAWAACVSARGIEQPGWPAAPVRLGVVFVIMFVALVGSSIRRRAADTEIVQAIESERRGARRLAAAELVYLLPAVVFGRLPGGGWQAKAAGRPAR